MKAWKKQEKEDKEREQGKPQIPTMTDPSQDPMFQAFIGRLRKAVAARDYRMIASMMTPEFGYRWDPIPAGDNVFAYWDQHGVWPELQSVVNEKFALYQPDNSDGSRSQPFMVAPAQFADDPEHYQGYRAGITTVNGAWKFAYFVPSPSAGQ